MDTETAQTVAIKQIDLYSISNENISSIEGEINLLKNLDHPNIVKYIECIRTKSHINLVLEYVENGKKHMPAAWNEKICTLYDLSEEQKREFTTAIAETEDAIEMNLVSANLGRRELAVSFARRFNNIDDAQVEAIRKILQRGDKK